MQPHLEDKTKNYTVAEAADRLPDRGLPVPPDCCCWWPGDGALAKESEDELNGIGIDEIEASTDREITNDPN